MFISRDGKESHLESLACFSALIVFYRFTLPPTLSKNYELFFKFAPRNFLSCTGSQRYISSGHDGLILIARLANQNFILTKGTVSDIIKKSYFKRLEKSPFD